MLYIPYPLLWTIPAAPVVAVHAMSKKKQNRLIGCLYVGGVIGILALSRLVPRIATHIGDHSVSHIPTIRLGFSFLVSCAIASIRTERVWIRDIAAFVLGALILYAMPTGW